MRIKHHIHSTLALLMLVGGLAWSTPTAAQDFGPSDTTVIPDLGKYEWPMSPCPEVQIKQKYDHTPLTQYRAKGWDTVVTCSQSQLELSCVSFIPTQNFGGQYTVDPIPYDPPDPTFDGGQKLLDAFKDDDFLDNSTTIPFDFFFFGEKKTAFVLGCNGMITFNTAAVGHICPPELVTQTTPSALPWPNTNTSAPYGADMVSNPTAGKGLMRDAIYGIYSDIQPTPAYLYGNQGIYYGIQQRITAGNDTCKMIIASFNGIPNYPAVRNLDRRNTYQIVCYEGSNIIEVHVKHRDIPNPYYPNPNFAILGIQNATGEPQTTGAPGTPSQFVINNSWAAYFPDTSAAAPNGFNPLTATLDSVAYRFTPRPHPGQPTIVHAQWYRLLDINNDGILDSLPLRKSSDPITDADTNGYYYDLEHKSDLRALSRAFIEPTCESRYVYHLTYSNATGHLYDLHDTIVVGVDRGDSLVVRPSGSLNRDTVLDICSCLFDTRLTMEFPELQDTAEMHYTITRINGGANTPLPDSLFVFGQMYTDPQTRMKRIPVILHPDATALSVQPGEIDSVKLTFQVTFASGCDKTVNFLVRTFPCYDMVVDTGICAGDTFHWDLNGNDYTSATTSPQVKLETVQNCDSVIHLHLAVSDVSYVTFPVSTCKPYTWEKSIGGNGKTYYETNTATAATDTVHLLNQWGCDSTVQLDFTIYPMTPIIDASLEYFDFNHMDVVLTDVSTGGNGRTWFFPTGDPQFGPVAYYSAPYNIDSAVIMLEEVSPYGCIDTAYLTIPFRRDVIWAPNVFTPDIPDGGNDRFHSKSMHLLKEETRVYNRFGELVFRCNEIDCEWDGTYPSGEPCPQGTYIYLIRYNTKYDPHTTHVLKGTVTLIR